MSSSSSPSQVREAPPETATWTEYLPERFGIRESIQQSPFRWCVRESAMWGVATGTAMGIHRLRMGSSPYFAGNVGFLTMFLVTIPSYYFCYRTRENKERMIELMMRANDWERAEDMPEAPKESPFLGAKQKEDKAAAAAAAAVQDQEYRARLPERKEWQTPLPQRDAKDVFQPVTPKEKG